MQNKKGLWLFLLLLFTTFIGSSFAASITPGNFIEAEDPTLERKGGLKNTMNGEDCWVFYSDGGWIKLGLGISEPGYYKLAIRACGWPYNGVLPTLFLVDNEIIKGKWELTTSSTFSVLMSHALYLEPGTHEVTLRYQRDLGKNETSLGVDWIALGKVNDPNQMPDLTVKGSPLSDHGQIAPINRSLLFNGDFENVFRNYGPSDVWFTWKVKGDGDCFAFNSYDTSEKKFGDASLSVQLKKDNTNINVPMTSLANFIKPDFAPKATDLVVSGWIKGSEGNTANAQIKMYCKDGGGEMWSPWATRKEFNIPVTSEWQYFEFIYPASLVPDSATGIDYVLVVRDGVGTVWFDSVALYPREHLEEDTPFPLNSSLLGEKIMLSWERQNYNLLYEIHRGTTEDFIPSDSTKIGETLENSYLDDSSDITQLYYYKVRSINDLWKARDSETALGDLVSPNPITELSVSKEIGGILIVNWQAPALAIDGERAAEYLIYRAQSEGELGKGNPIAKVTEDQEKTAFSWRDRAVTPGEEYYYAIVSVDRVGHKSPLSTAIGPVIPDPDITDPNPPANVEISNSPNGAIALSWQRPLPAEDDDLPEKYYIYRSTESTGGGVESVKIDEVEAPAEQEEFKFTDVQVEPGVTYYYYIRSIDKTERWAESEEISALVLTAGIPTLLGPVQGDVIANLPLTFSWEAPALDYEDEVVSYTLRYANDPELENAIEVASLDETQLTLAEIGEGIVPGKVYWQVRAHYRSGVVGTYSAVNSFALVETENQKFPASYFAITPQVVRLEEEIAFNYVLAADGWVTIKVFDSKGKLVGECQAKQWQNAKDGETYLLHHLTWDGRDLNGKLVRDGLYLGQLVLERTGERPIVITRRFQVFRSK
jgi:fibronectin type 3 domain-containing protein